MLIQRTENIICILGMSLGILKDQNDCSHFFSRAASELKTHPLTLSRSCALTCRVCKQNDSRCSYPLEVVLRSSTSNKIGSLLLLRATDRGTRSIVIHSELLLAGIEFS